MSSSGRHNSHGSDNYNNHTTNPYTYVDQSMSSQQYLRPEDVYRLEREGTYFTSTSYPQSRHASESNSPRHKDTTPPDQTSRHQSNPHSPYVEYPYTDLTRHGSGGVESGFASSRRVTPPDQSTSTSRHSPAGSHGGSDKDREQSKSGSGQTSPKGKGKERAEERHSDSRRRGTGGRHDSGDGVSGRRRPIGPSQGRLISGVFIRY